MQYPHHFFAHCLWRQIFTAKPTMKHNKRFHKTEEA